MRPSNGLSKCTARIGGYTPLMRAAVLEGSIIEVRGDDSREWLNGQLTAQIADAKDGEVRRGLKLDRTGRILAMPWVFCRGEEFDLFVEREGAKELLEDLDRYIIMEDVELSLREDTRALFLEGERGDGIFACATLYGMEGAIRILEEGEIVESIVQTRGAELLDGQALETARIRSGTPGRPEFERRRLLPQEAGLKELVSFTKGCFLGQEPVVMLEHRGSPPKRLIRLEMEPTLARSLKSEGTGGIKGADITDDTGAAVGEITSVSSNDERGFAIGLLRKRGFTLDTLHLRASEGAPSAAVTAFAFIGEPPDN